LEKLPHTSKGKEGGEKGRTEEGREA